MTLWGFYEVRQRCARVIVHGFVWQPGADTRTVRRMARSYRDAVELSTAPVDKAVFPFVEEGAVILEGTRHPAVADAVPIILSPGSEYRIRCVEVEGERVWSLSRRAAPKIRIAQNHNGAPPPTLASEQ